MGWRECECRITYDSLCGKEGKQMITIRNKKGKRSKLFYFVWSAPLIGSACVLILLGYITYFSTDVLGLPSGLVGLLLLLSKIFDGVTGI